MKNTETQNIIELTAQFDNELKSLLLQDLEQNNSKKATTESLMLPVSVAA